ncbi:unnamed protein product, partial [Rotaria magnacalcarata]
MVLVDSSVIAACALMSFFNRIAGTLSRSGARQCDVG